MNENTQKRTMRNAYHIIKLDRDNWDDITAFVERYHTITIEICAANKNEKYDDMEDAYDAICKYTDDIHLIIIKASKDDEEIEIRFTNDDMPITYLQEFKYTCTNEREYKVRDFYYNLREESKVFKKESSSISRLLLLLCYLALFSVQLLNYYTIAVFVVFSFAAFVAIYFVFDDRIMNPFIGKKQIQFWISKDKIDRYEQTNKKVRNVAKVLNIISVIIVIATIIVGYIAIKLTW